MKARQGDRPRIPIKERCPKWAVPLLKPARYKGLYGGRGGGKSHFMAEMLIERCVEDPNLRAVCIREIQKSLKFSAKLLIEEKIEELGYGDRFEILQSEIRHRDGKGLIIFQGMQDHTADSIKSLEGFEIAWVEEAQNLSRRSLRLLRPTIRREGSEIWFSWNPENESDPVDEFLRGQQPKDSVVIATQYTDNPHLPETLRKEAEEMRSLDSDEYQHVWMGGYNKKAKEQVFADRWVVDTFVPKLGVWDGPYFGADFGFSSHPGALVKCWVHHEYLYVEYGAYNHHTEMNDIADVWRSQIPGCDEYTIRADSAEPKTISYLQRHGMYRVVGVKKWPNSVEEGVRHIRSYKKIIVHERCTDVAYEMQNYKHKVDKRSGDILPDIVDANNHCCDAIRYALQPIIEAALSRIDVDTIDETRTIYTDAMSGY